MRKIRVFLLLLLLLILANCASTNLPPLTEVPSLDNLQEDEKSIWSLANELEEKLNKNIDIFDDQDLENYITDIANNISPPLIKSKIKFRVKIIRDSELNAFALPNGAIYINLGLLAKIQNEDQLVTILGHEMAHVILRHSIIHFRDIKNKAAIYRVTSTCLLISGVNLSNLLNELGYVITLASIQGYSRHLETEADTYGFNLMIKNGYNPYEGIKIYYQLLEETRDIKNNTPYFFSSHPRIENRIKNLECLIKKDQNFIKTSSKKRNNFFIKMAKKAIIAALKLDIDSNRYKSAERTIALHSKVLGKETEFECLKGYLFYKKGDLEKSKQILTKILEIDRSKCNCLCCPQKILGLIFYKKNKSISIPLFEEYLQFSINCSDHNFIKYLIRKFKNKIVR